MISHPAPGADTLRRVRDGHGLLTAAALRRLDEDLPWYRALPAEDRSWVGLVAQAGIRAFISWYGEAPGTARGVGEIFAAAPPELTRSISCSRRSSSCGSRWTSSRRTATTSRRPATSGTCARPSCGTPARSPSRPQRSTPAPPRCAGPGTRGSRRSSSTRSCAVRRTTRCGRGCPHWAGRAAGRPSSWSARRAPLRRRPRRRPAPRHPACRGRRAGRDPGRPARRLPRRRERPPRGRRHAAAAVRARARRHRAPRPGAGGLGPVGPRRARRPPRRTGLGAGPPPRLGRRPPARAGPDRGHHRPEDAGRPGVPAPTRQHRLAARDALRVPGQRSLPRGRRPDPVRAPQHGPVPPAEGVRGDRLGPARPARVLRPADRARPGAARRTVVASGQTRSGSLVRVVSRACGRRPAQWTRARRRLPRPGCPVPRHARPLARAGGRAAPPRALVARRRAGPRRPRHDVRRGHDPRHRGRPAPARGRRAAELPGAGRRARDLPARRRAGGPRSRGRRRRRGPLRGRARGGRRGRCAERGRGAVPRRRARGGHGPRRGGDADRHERPARR